MAGDEGGFDEIENRLGDFLAFPNPIQKREAAVRIDIIAVQWRPHYARCDHIDADVVRREFRREADGQRMDAPLADQWCRCGEAADSVINEHRTDVNDGAAVALLLHLPNHGLGRQIRTA